MTKEPEWISKETLLLLHSESIAEFGGSMGIRDKGLLESALAKPQNRFACEQETDIAVLAASYGFGIAKNHPFVDGNKRAALSSIGLFLGLNGTRLTASQPATIKTILGLAAGNISEEKLAQWIGGNISELGTQ